jgi:hypothetical protein
VKTEVEGQVVWTLPCNLNVGLPANPRLEDEGLACYFLRLFMDGITGLTGPQGPPGDDGDDGRNAYTVTLLTFLQPSLAAPLVQVKTLYNPCILENLVVFIQNSGWYHVDALDQSGNLWLTLIQPVVGVNVGDAQLAGKLVVPTGPQGASITGPVGPAGPTGPVGPTGGTYTTTNGQTLGSGSEYALSNVLARVVFGTIEPEVTLPTAGTYLITATISIRQDTGSPATPPDGLQFKLWDANAAAYVPGSTVASQCTLENEITTVTIIVLYTIASPNHTIQLYGKSTGASGDAYVTPAGDSETMLTYVKLA